MSNAKEQMRELLEVLPDDVTFDDVHYHIFVREKIDQGIKDIEQGKVISTKEMETFFHMLLEE
jgi:hypothetical protein